MRNGSSQSSWHVLVEKTDQMEADCAWLTDVLAFTRPKLESQYGCP